MTDSRGFNVKLVCLHFGPDFDAISAYWLAKKHPRVFRGINDAPVRFLSQGVSGHKLWNDALDLLDQIQDKRAVNLKTKPVPEDNKVNEELEKIGVILFDVGEGRFDHHPTDIEENRGKCAIEKVAEYLGVQDDKLLKKILAYVHLHDLEGRNVARNMREMNIDQALCANVALLEAFSLASIFSIQKSVLNDSTTLLIEWLCKVLNTIYEKQKHFWTMVAQEYEKKARISDVMGNKRNYRVVVIESDEREVGSYSRTKDGGNCNVCIHRYPKTGHTFISGSLLPEEFVELAKLLRVAELQKRRIAESYDLRDLARSKFPLNPVWHIAKDSDGNAFIVMNGGDKAPEVSPSLLTLEEIHACLTLALIDNYFPPECIKPSCLGSFCPLYKFGLSRCLNVRHLK